MMYKRSCKNKIDSLLREAYNKGYNDALSRSKIIESLNDTDFQCKYSFIPIFMNDLGLPDDNVSEKDYKALKEPIFNAVKRYFTSRLGQIGKAWKFDKNCEFGTDKIYSIYTKRKIRNFYDDINISSYFDWNNYKARKVFDYLTTLDDRPILWLDFEVNFEPDEDMTYLDMLSMLNI